jgi:hypothetical protein
VSRTERLQRNLASYRRRADRRHALGLTTLGRPFKRHPNQSPTAAAQRERELRRQRYHLQAQLNFRLGLTSRGAPRKRRPNYAMLSREFKISVRGYDSLIRREAVARYHRRASKFHAQGLTYNGRAYRRPLARRPSALDLDWRKLRAGISLPRFSLETTVFERSES